MDLKQGAWIATAAAALLSLGGCGSDDRETTASTGQEVKCQGANECKGQGECAGKGDGANSCQGMNECKGKGWITLPDAKTCTDKGGSVLT